MTPEWKAKVLSILDLNAESGRVPGNPTDLARLIGADKGGIHRALMTKQPGSKYVRAICKLLDIDEPKLPVIDDEWSRIVTEARTWPAERQEHAIALLRTFFTKKLDGK